MSEQINTKKIAFLNAFLQIEENIDSISELGYLLRDDTKIIDMWFDKAISIWKELDPLLKPGESHTWHVVSEPQTRAGDTVTYESMGIKDSRYWDSSHANRLRPSAFHSLRRAVLHAEYQCDSMVSRLEEFRRHIHTFLAKTPFQRDVPEIEPNDPILAKDKLTILMHLTGLEGVLLRHRDTGDRSAVIRGQVLQHHSAMITTYAKLSPNLTYVCEEEREVYILELMSGSEGRMHDGRFLDINQDQGMMVSKFAFGTVRQVVEDVTDLRVNVVYYLDSIVKAVEKEIWG